MGRFHAIAALGAILLLSAGLYFAAGLQHAYLVADDFQWLSAGHLFSGLRSVPLPVGDGFYRPLVTLWFAGAVRACRSSEACYHTASLVIHLLNVSLVFSLALSLSRDLRIAFLATLLFALEPAYAQAVVWISAATELLSTFFYLASLQAQVMSWRPGRHDRRHWELLAILCFVAALFCHEAAITLPLVTWLMWRHFGPTSLVSRPVMVAGLGACVVLFGLTAVVANYRNPLIATRTYTLGPHMVQHAFDYLVGLYVGPPGTFAYAACAIAIVGLLLFTPMTRFGSAWLLVTLVPYVGFTWGNVSRYSYLPSIGFAFAIGAVIVVGCDWLGNRFSGRMAINRFSFGLALLFVALRFGRFDYSAIRNQVAWTEEWRTLSDDIVREARPVKDGVFTIPPDGRHGVDPGYIEPLLRWVHHDYELTVIVQ